MLAERSEALECGSIRNRGVVPAPTLRNRAMEGRAPRDRGHTECGPPTLNKESRGG